MHHFCLIISFSLHIYVALAVLYFCLTIIFFGFIVQYFYDVDNTVKKCITYFGLIVYLCVMAVVNRHRVTVNLEFRSEEHNV